MGWILLGKEEIEQLEQAVKFYYRLGDLYSASALAALDGELRYMRYHADLSEPARAIRPMAYWFGFQLAAFGWRWAEDPSGAIAVISPEGRTACRLLQLLKTLFDDDRAPYFSELTASMAAGELVELDGIVKNLEVKADEFN
ncbi:MAG TPA: hypothetical protein VH186_09880 [Chloroflexia bacterium]|nr:hypothetical protein [Chloroflexia bacterium]